MAARGHPQDVRSAHQSMHHHRVVDSQWSDEAVLAACAGQIVPVLTHGDTPCFWIVDDTGFPKKEGAFGGRSPAVLWAAREDGELPSGGEPLAVHRAG